MPIAVEIANNEEWNAVQPVAEMMGGPKPRCLSPGLKFKIFGLEDLKVYTVGMVFFKSEDKFTFSKDTNTWLPWKTGIEAFPEQKVTMDAAIGGDLGVVDFSKITMTTNEKLPAKDDQIIVHTHHIYSAMLSITELDTQETILFTDQRLQFVVVTNTNPRVKAQKQLLDALQEPEKMAKKAKKEELEKKRAEKKLKRPAPAPEYVNKYKHLIGTEQFEKMKPRFIIRRDPPAEPPAKRQRVEEEVQVVQPAPQPVYPVANEPEFAPVFYDPCLYQAVEQPSTSGSGYQSPWNEQNENVPPEQFVQRAPIGNENFGFDAEKEGDWIPFSPSQFDMNSGAIVEETTPGYNGNFATENWTTW